MKALREQAKLLAHAPFNGGTRVIIVLTALGLAGSAIGVYTSLHGDVVENQRAIADLSRELRHFQEQTEQWQAREQAYDAELRARVSDNDREMRAGMRTLAEKVIDIAKEKP